MVLLVSQFSWIEIKNTAKVTSPRIGDTAPGGASSKIKDLSPVEAVYDGTIEYISETMPPLDLDYRVHFYYGGGDCFVQSVTKR